IASLYEAFPAEQAHRLARRLEIHFTPRSGSWMNIAEIELGVLTRQCLDRRIGTKEELSREITAWEIDRNTDHSVVQWRFTTPDARISLRHLYPQFSDRRTTTHQLEAELGNEEYRGETTMPFSLPLN